MSASARRLAASAGASVPAMAARGEHLQRVAGSERHLRGGCGGDQHRPPARQQRRDLGLAAEARRIRSELPFREGIEPEEAEGAPRERWCAREAVDHGRDGAHAALHPQDAIDRVR
jgi:hypothetical protein